MTTPKTKLAGLALIAALVFGTTASAWAGSGEHRPWENDPTGMSLGKDAFGRGDYAGALREWRSVAKYGGVESAEAQILIAGMYFNGRGVPRDYAEAAKWYRKAAEQGAANAQFNLGLMYRIGQGIPQDDAKAVKWYRQAAEQGHPAAQSNLGTMYGYGYGVPQDYVQAHIWINLAVSRLPPGEDRDKAVKNRDHVASKMTPTQIAEAQKLAREWMPVFERWKQK